MNSKAQFKPLPAVFPDMGFCFCLGFLSTAIWLGGFVFCFDALAEIVFTGKSSAAPAFWQHFLLYGAAGGFFSVLVGYMVRHVQPRSSNRWIWLSFVVPLCTFILSSSSGHLSGQIQINGTTGASDGIDEIFYALCFHGTAALMIGAAVVTTIGAFKLVKRILLLIWKTSNPFETIDSPLGQ